MNSNNLNFISFNARSISSISKFNKFKSLIASLPKVPNIIIVQETWFSEDKLNLYEITNYKAIHSFRQDSYGGVSVYIQQHFDYQVKINKVSFNCNIIALKILQRNCSSFNLVAFYRPPSCSLKDFLQVLKASVEVPNCNTVVAGDVNIDLLSSSNQTNQLRRTLSSMGLIPCINEITRQQSRTCIDHIYASSILSNKVRAELVHTELSDHDVICCDVEGLIVENRSTMKITRTTINYIKVREELNKRLSEADRYNGTPDEMYNKLECDINEVICSNKVTTVREVHSRYMMAPWIDNRLSKLIDRKNRLLKKTKRNPRNQNLFNKFERINGVVKEALREKAQGYYRNEINNCKGDIGKVWKVINTAIGGKYPNKDVLVLKDVDGRDVSDPSEVSRIFNKYFSEVGTSLSATIKKHRNDDINMFQTLHQHRFFKFSRTSSTEVMDVIQDLDIKKASGIDGIPPAVIKNSAKEISHVLSNIFNKMIIDGVYPKLLKLQKTTPIHKKGDPKNVSNYRPIAVLPVINKCFEKLIYKRILEHLDETNFLYGKQFGFRRGVGTMEACIDLIDKICENINKKQLVGGIFLDLTKAFDTIDHGILLQKLSLLGLDDISLKLMHSYLTDRRQVVCIADKISDEEEINIGVPQGSVLGPLLFLIFINDISQLPLLGEIYLFADDSSIFYPGSNSSEIKRKMERDMVILNEFFRLNRISINIAKTKIMIFSTNRKQHHRIKLEFENCQIEESTNVKFLGLQLDCNLDWTDHCRTVLTKVSQGLGALYKFRNKFDLQTRRMIYFALIHCHLNYCTSLWGRSTLSKNIQVLQNRALRVVYNVPPRYNRAKLYELANVLPLQSIHTKQVCNYIFKYKNDGIVSSFQHRFETRGRNNVVISVNRLGLTSQRISVNGCILFNSLPRIVKEKCEQFQLKIT